MDTRILCATPTCEEEDLAILQVAGGRSKLDLSGDEQLNVSGRSYDRILKLARTIADLAGSDEIQSVRLTEALEYRSKLMMG